MAHLIEMPLTAQEHICVSELSNTAQEKVVKSEQMARDARQCDENKIVK